MYALEFEAVSKVFQSQRPVVDSLSFKIKKGEFFSILGPSGCGKTTSLRMISGLEKPTSGTILMDGKVVNDLHPHKRPVHTVFQRYALFPHLSVFENVAFGLRMRKVDEQEIQRRVNRMLQMVKMTDYAERSITKLSGGEQQRVALVRALVNEPEILLLDEPLGALDAKLRDDMQQELLSIQKQTGITFIFVTHDQSEALTLSDRIAIMNQGKLEQCGTPAEIYERPASSFVAEFVGNTNLFHGEVVQETQVGQAGDEKKLIAVDVKNYGKIQVQVVNGQSQKVRMGLKSDIVVRPEKIRLRSTAPENHNANTLRGQVIERIYLGATTELKLKINDQVPPLKVLLANQSSIKTQTVNLGDKLYAVWEASDTVLLP